jgi:hypothetical protein
MGLCAVDNGEGGTASVRNQESLIIKINGLNSVGNGRMEDSWMPKEKCVKGVTRREKRSQKAEAMKDRYCGS